MSEMYRQNVDGSWSPAKPIRLPWTIRVWDWMRGRRADR